MKKDLFCFPWVKASNIYLIWWITVAEWFLCLFTLCAARHVKERWQGKEKTLEVDESRAETSTRAWPGQKLLNETYEWVDLHLEQVATGQFSFQYVTNYCSWGDRLRNFSSLKFLYQQISLHWSNMIQNWTELKYFISIIWKECLFPLCLPQSYIWLKSSRFVSTLWVTFTFYWTLEQLNGVVQCPAGVAESRMCLSDCLLPHGAPGIAGKKIKMVKWRKTSLSVKSMTHAIHTWESDLQLSSSLLLIS